MKARMMAMVVAWTLCSVTGTAVAGGTLLEVTVPGPAIEGNLLQVASARTVSVYLPPSYEDDTQRRYPTVYILHGIFDTNRTWTVAWDNQHPGYDTIQSLMDAGIAAGLLQEMIVVVPDCDKAAHYTDGPVRGGWETFVARDLVSFIDARYRTVQDATGRGIAGHSMGGHGAIKISMKHPHVFSVAYGLNPSLLGWGGDVAPDNPAFAGLGQVQGLGDLQGAHFYVQAVVAVGHAFAPNPQAPLLTNLPFAPQGDTLAFTQPGQGQWQSQMPLHMLDTHGDGLRQLRGLRFDSAFIDEYTHIPVTSKAFSDALTARGIPHVFEMYNGDHRNRLWGRQGRLYTALLPWFSGLFEASATVDTSRSGVSTAR